MDKETLQAFLRPFTDEIQIRLRLDGRVLDFSGINYGFENDGDGVICLECSAKAEEGPKCTCRVDSGGSGPTAWASVSTDARCPVHGLVPLIAV